MANILLQNDCYYSHLALYLLRGSTDMMDYYQILESGIDATQAEIKEQYHFLLHAWHPDKFPTLAEKQKAHDKIRVINEAYEILGNPVRREKYDRERLTTSSPANSAGTSSKIGRVENYEWLLGFKANKRYAAQIDPGCGASEWKESSTSGIQKYWRDNQFHLNVSQPGKVSIEASSRIVSEILLTVKLHFLQEVGDQVEAGIAFGIGYEQYLPARYFRFGLNKKGIWKLSYSDRSTGEAVFATDFSEIARQLISDAQPMQLELASFENRVSLAIQHNIVGGTVTLPQYVCGTCGIFVGCPENTTFAEAGFSNFHRYFILEM